MAVAVLAVMAGCGKVSMTGGARGALTDAAARDARADGEARDATREAGATAEAGAPRDAAPEAPA
ncbi:MAG TPA: hypothetical protein VHO06_19115, partial [Polyangia bacterium]|nr:hypothetical protein [Polyangia bacterium]